MPKVLEWVRALAVVALAAPVTLIVRTGRMGSRENAAAQDVRPWTDPGLPVRARRSPPDRGSYRRDARRWPSSAKWISRPALCLLLALLVAATTGCGLFSSKEDAEAVARRFYEALARKEYDRALEFYSPSFFQKTKPDEWRGALERIQTRLGDFESYRLTTWKVHTGVGTGESGTWYQLQYSVKYRRYEAMEALVLFRPSGAGEIKIVGHQINSPGLLQ